jgi:alpha-beta hydrolase superfamily lysophospholipase
MISSHTFYKLSDGTQLRIKIVDNGAPTWLFAMHGLGEHLGRHLYLEDVLGSKYNYIFLDHRGHGMSGGKRAYIDSFETFAQDLSELIKSMVEKFSIESYGIYAHSMGTLVACDFYKNFSEDMLKPSAMFLSSPAVGFPGLGKVLGLSPASLTGLIKDLPMSFDIDGEEDHERYSHDSKVLYDLLNDPLINQHTESKLMMEIVHRANEVFEDEIEFSCPVAITIGTHDKVVCPNSAYEYFTTKSLADQITVVPGGYHELFVETEKYKAPYIEALKTFINGRLPSRVEALESQIRDKVVELPV